MKQATVPERMATKVAVYLFGLGVIKSLFSLLEQPHCLRGR